MTSEVSGTTITFMPEDTVTVPLWDETGLLNDDPSWLNQELGLSAELVADIAAWGESWNDTEYAVERRNITPEQYRERQRRLEAEARILVERLRAELPADFNVRLCLPGT